MTCSSPTRSADAWRGGRDARERTLAPTRRMIGLSVCHAMQPVGLVMGVANNVRVRAGFSSVVKRSDDIHHCLGCRLRHSRLVSSSLILYGSGNPETRIPARLLAYLPNLINSSSPIACKRPRSLRRCASSDSKPIMLGNLAFGMR